MFDVASLSHIQETNVELWERYWGHCNHDDYYSILRKRRASLGYLTPIYIDHKNGIARFCGSNCDYQTTIISCECSDFHKRQMPCKHMYRLAHELGIFFLNTEVVTVPEPRKILNNYALSNIKTKLSNQSLEILERIIHNPNVIVNTNDAYQLIHLNVAIVDSNKYELLNFYTKQKLIDLLPPTCSGVESLKKSLLIEKIIDDYPYVISEIEKEMVPLKLSPYASRFYEQYFYL